MSWLNRYISWDYESVVTAPIRAYNATIGKDVPIEQRTTGELLKDWSGGATKAIGGGVSNLLTGKIILVIAVIAFIYFLPRFIPLIIKR